MRENVFSLTFIEAWLLAPEVLVLLQKLLISLNVTPIFYTELCVVSLFYAC